MEPTKNLCAQLPLALHAKVREEQGKSGMTLSEYMTEILTQFYNKKGEPSTMENTRPRKFLCNLVEFSRQ